jgi:hypothetical protein
LDFEPKFENMGFTAKKYEVLVGFLPQIDVFYLKLKADTFEF